MTAIGGRTAMRPIQPKRWRGWLAFALLVPAASCVPGGHDVRSAGSLAALTIPLPDAAPAPTPAPRAARTFSPSPAAPSIVFDADSSLDRMRALDCLAEAIYYEARSEGEAGQRAVAQTVLNRVRHPAYPGSVCGVVHQGPMKAGTEGCQFTFTCDGSLARRPFGAAWARARHIATEALAGKVYDPVGHATHYHTFKVAPRWAPALTKVAVIGSHIFYRRPGPAGAPAAFRQAYSGREPGRIAMAGTPAPQAAVPPPADTAPPVELASNRLPESQVRPEWAHSGRWKDQN